MRSVRALLCALYGFVGVFVFYSGWLVVRNHFWEFPDGRLSVLRACLEIIANLILPLSGTLMIMAAVSYFVGWRSARMWGLVVSFLFFALPLLAALVTWRFAHQSGVSFFGEQRLLLGIGTLGIFAFWTWKPSKEKARNDSAQPGDGTISIINRLVPVVEWLVFFAIWDAWIRWAAAVGLARPALAASLLQITIAGILMAALHEAGHAFTGIALGMKVRSFMAGPFQWREDRGRWRFAFHPLGLLQTGGSTGVVPQLLDQPKSQELAVIVAGPLVNVATAVPALWAARTVIHTGWHNYWYWLAVFGSVSLLGAAVNLLPFKVGSTYSDGARIFQLLRGGVWSDLHRALQINAATTVTAIRPRDFDIDGLERVIAAGISTGPMTILLRLVAHSYYQDRGQLRHASKQIEDIEQIYGEFAAQIPAEWHYTPVIDTAVQRHDAMRARLWWDRAEAKKPKLFNGDYWMARSALAWIEGERNEAQSSWAKADEYLRGMPHTGTYEFDRDCLAALKKTIATDPVARVPEVVEFLRS